MVELGFKSHGLELFIRHLRARVDKQADIQAEGRNTLVHQWLVQSAPPPWIVGQQKILGFRINRHLNAARGQTKPAQDQTFTGKDRTVAFAKRLFWIIMTTNIDLASTYLLSASLMKAHRCLCNSGILSFRYQSGKRLRELHRKMRLTELYVWYVTSRKGTTKQNNYLVLSFKKL